MTKQELSMILNKMVSNAPRGRISTQYHLFGIEYVLFINEADFTADDIAEEAGFSRKYGIEIRKGIRLAEMVELKNENLVKRQSEKIKQLQNRLQ